VNELMDRIEEYTLPLTDCILEYPVDALFVTGPHCAKSGPIISPQMQGDLILSRVETALERVRPSGVPVILHTDGDNTAFLDWILANRFAGLHPVEPGCGEWDIFRLKQVCGDRLCLCGNIDVAGVLSQGAPADVREDTLDHLRRLAPGGGYICGSSHDISENIPPENVLALAETICGYRGDRGKA
jgi:uroporphyrinogen decarboxylase